MNLRLMVKELKGMGIKDKKVLNGMTKVDRKFFVLREYSNNAYDNHALPILEGQTISQPYTVAIMLEALDLKKGDKVLEVGTGSGYNAALISNITKSKVYTIEKVKKLVDFAKKNLEKAKIKSVKVICDDGSKGYFKEKPYDKIIVTAACPKIIEPLLKQLKINGILVIPVGSLHFQELLKIKKLKEGKTVKNLGNFVFVPLRGKFGWG